MSRWLGGLFAVLLILGPLLALDKPKDEKGKDRSTRFTELKKSFEKARNDAVKAFEAAKTDKDKEAAIEKYRKPGDQVAKVLKLVEADPKDTLAFDMLLWALQVTQGQNDKVYELLAEYQVKNPKLASICRMLSSSPPTAARKLFQKVLDENPNKEAKAFACYDLAQLANDNASEGDPAASLQAEKLYERIVKEFADVKSGRGSTLGEIATKERKFLVGKTAPNVESVNLEGKKVQLTDYKGKVVVLDIWATWCPPCRGMIPHERDMVNKLKEKPFALISISADAKKDTLETFIEKTPMPWTHWWNGQKGGILEDWNIRAFPTIFVLDSKGVIRYKFIGDPKEKLEEAVEKLVAEVKK